MEKRILSILVDNTSGVLSRVAGLFSRRGYNIDSITAGVTADQRYSRMTVVCEGDDQMLQQITKQLAKQEDVRDVKVLEQDDSVARELMLVKVRAMQTSGWRSMQFPRFSVRRLSMWERFCHCYADRRPVQTGRAD